MILGRRSRTSVNLYERGQDGTSLTNAHAVLLCHKTLLYSNFYAHGLIDRGYIVFGLAFCL
jgi:hypothetical protein